MYTECFGDSLVEPPYLRLRCRLRQAIECSVFDRCQGRNHLIYFVLNYAFVFVAVRNYCTK